MAADSAGACSLMQAPITANNADNVAFGTEACARSCRSMTLAVVRVRRSTMPIASDTARSAATPRSSNARS